MADAPDDLGNPFPVVLAVGEAVAESRMVLVCDTFVDLAVEQPWCRLTQPSSKLLGLIDAEVGLVLPTPLCLPRPPPPRPWMQVTVGRPGDAAGMRLVTPLSHPEPSAVRLRAQVTVSPATLVEVALAPPVVQVVEVASSAEVHPQAAEDSGVTGSNAAVVDSPTWAEKVKMQEEELHAMSALPPRTTVCLFRTRHHHHPIQPSRHACAAI